MAGDINKIWGYVLAMFAGYSGGWYVYGQDKIIGFGPNDMPIRPASSPDFVLGAILFSKARVMIGLGGANLLNKAGHEEWGTGIKR